MLGRRKGQSPPEWGCVQGMHAFQTPTSSSVAGVGNPVGGALGAAGRPSQVCGIGLWLLRVGLGGVAALGPAREGEVRLWPLTQVGPSRLLLTSPFALGEGLEVGRQRVVPSGQSSAWG